MRRRGQNTEIGITAELIHNGKEFRNRIDNLQKFQNKQLNIRPKLIVSEERRKIKSERTKHFWKDKKRLARKT